MSDRGTPILQLPRAEFDAALDRIFGPDPLDIRCTFCGQEEGEFCTTPSGRATVHAARRKAVGAT